MTTVEDGKQFYSKIFFLHHLSEENLIHLVLMLSINDSQSTRALFMITTQFCNGAGKTTPN